MSLLWQVTREDIQYYIYDDKANAIGYFTPDYGTNEEDRIIDLITDEASVRGGRLSLYISILPIDDMHYSKFLEWISDINNRLKKIKDYQISKGLDEPLVRVEHNMLLATFDIRFDRRVELTKKSLSNALSNILNEMKTNNII